MDTESGAYQVFLPIQVAAFLRSWEKGELCPATLSRVALPPDAPTGDAIGILYTDPNAEPTKYWFGIVTKMPRRAFWGTLWLNDPRRRNAEHWVIEMRGNQYKNLVMQLAADLKAKFNVNVIVRMMFTQTELEVYASEDGP